MLQTQINADFTSAYKTKDEVTKNALSMLKNAILIKQKEPGAPAVLSDDAILKVINGMVKQNEKSITAFPANCIKEIEDINTETRIISRYLPAEFTEDELKTILTEMVALNTEGPLARRIGQTIGAFNKLHAGKAKGEKVKQVLETIMS